MLPTHSRLHTAAQFSAVMRGGRRVGSRSLVVHLLTGSDDVDASWSGPPAADRTAVGNTVAGRPVGGTPRGGFVVSGRIGNAVVRHRITRRLRPVLRDELSALPPGTDVVVRALPPAATVAPAELRDDLRVALRAAARKAGVGPVPVR